MERNLIKKNLKKIGPRLIAIETLNLTIFLFFYLGTRFFSFIYLGIQYFRKKLLLFDAVIISTILFSIILTILLVQKAEWWNTIQFFYYAIFLSTIYLTKLTFDLIQTKKITLIILAVIIIILSIPTSYDMTKFFLETPGATYLSKEEEDGLNFLKKQPDGIVYKALYKQEWKNYSKPNKLYTYEDTAYVSAFSGKQEYFSDELQLRLIGIPYKKRLERMKHMDCSILKEVDYVYEVREMPDEDKIVIKCKHPSTRIIYINGKIIIYSIPK